MEIWKEVFIDEIPKGVYQMQMVNGEQQGLTIELSNNNVCVTINFGIIQAVRMLDEGIVQCNLYSDNEIKKYKSDNFKNVIYEVHEGEFGKQINKISGGYGDVMNLKHYIIITQNYNVDIVTQYEPTIDIVKI